MNEQIQRASENLAALLSAQMRGINLDGSATPQQIKDAWANFVSGSGGAQPNVIDAFPVSPVERLLYLLTQGGQPVATPVAGKEYNAIVKAPPTMPPAPYIPASFDAFTTLDGIKNVVLMHGSVSDIFSKLGELSGYSFSVDTGGDSPMLSVSLVGASGFVMYVYFTDYASVSGVQFTPGWPQGENSFGLVKIGAAPDELNGVWNFTQEDIDSGIPSALLDITFPAGLCYFDGNDWIPVDVSGGSDLAARVAILQNAVEDLRDRVNNLEEGINPMGEIAEPEEPESP